MVKAGPPADLVQDFAVPLPGLMICEMLGVPYADRDRFRERVSAFMSTTALTAGQRGTQTGQLTLMLLTAGYESTASQITNFAYALLTHPDQLALVRSRPGLMPGAVEELMRWVPLLVTADTLPCYALDDTASTSPATPKATWGSDTAPTIASAPR
jgi:cytochrome P450